MAGLPPVWLLDVDGVINASRPGWNAVPWKGYAYENATEHKIRWAPQLIARIYELHRASLVEIRWCSTWCAYADQLERLFRLPPLGRAFHDDVRGIAASIAKLAAVRQVLAERRPLIWTDDDETPTAGPLYDELTAGGQALLIRPRTGRGLRPQHLDAIEAFTRSHQGGVPHA
ncbi:hypothetical protein [Micromonospora sp. RV43]|uniref:hypothetical protein n=1 Tax=Micromonospora sp. RV43 TaxID=1661387 RepID=UPI00064BDD33|nr:hypothetical protein [Micromonospora sp. RV43]